MQKRIVSLFLCAALLFGLLPAGVFAQDPAEGMTIDGNALYTEEITEPISENNNGETVENTEKSSFTGVSALLADENHVITAPTPKTGLTYNEGPQKLVNPGTAEDGYTMKYCIPGTGFTEEVPEMTDAGTYFVAYEIVDNSTGKTVFTGEIGNVEIAKRGLYYHLRAEDKPYDGTTTVVGMREVFFSEYINGPQIYLKETDYTLQAEFVSPDVADFVDLVSTLELVPGSDADRNNTIIGVGSQRGNIVKGHLTGFHDATVYVRYFDTSEQVYNASLFGVNENDGVYWDGVMHNFKSAIFKTFRVWGTISFSLAEGLDKTVCGEYFGKMHIYSADGKYESGRYSIQMNVIIVEKLPPQLTVGDIEKDYDGTSFSIDDLNKSAVCNGKTVPGTWAWKDVPPTECADRGENSDNMFALTFTPDDTETYSVAETKVRAVINPARPTQENTVVTVTPSEFHYNGKAQKPVSVKVEYGGKTLTPSADYTFSFGTDYVDAGNKNVRIDFCGNYSGTLTAQYVIKPCDCEPTAALSAQAFTYDGKPKEPAVTVRDAHGNTLAEDTDYTIEYSGNTNAGTAKVTVRAANKNHAFSDVEKTFKINKSTAAIKNSSYPAQFAYGTVNMDPQQDEFIIENAATGASFTWEWYKDGVKLEGKPKELGVYMLRVTVGETENSTAASCDVTVEIVRNTTLTTLGTIYFDVYNNQAETEYLIDFKQDLNNNYADAESISLHGTDGNIMIVNPDGTYAAYDPDKCDFTITVQNGEKEGTLRVLLKGLNREVNGTKICLFAVSFEDKNNTNLSEDVALVLRNKNTAVLDGLKMESFTYGDTPGTPQYNALSETVNKTEFKYYDSQNNLLTGAPADAGKYTVEVICETAKTVYSASTDYEIYKKDISDAEVELDGELVYNTAVQTQKIKSVSVGNLAVTTFDVSENTATDAGNYTLKITGTGNFTGTETVGFKVLKKTVMADATVGGEYTYIAEEIKPSDVTVKDGQNVIPDSEYTLGYSDNINAGNATVTVNNKDGGNYIVSGSAIFVIKKAKLTVAVNDVTREYGSANPELSVTYSGFVNGENVNTDGVLSGSLVLEYDDSINAETPVETYIGYTKASGLSADNYEIEYKNGNVTITKIPVSAAEGIARNTFLTVIFDKSVPGLAAANFEVMQDQTQVTLTGITVSADNKTYTLNGKFAVGKEHTVEVNFDGSQADSTLQFTGSALTFKPVRSGGSFGGGTGTVIGTAGGKNDKNTKKDNTANQLVLYIGQKDALVFGNAVTNDVAPKIHDDRTMLPARFVAENLGAEVSWDGEKQLVTVKGRNLKTGEDITILICIGSDTAYVNGKEVKLDSAAFIENDRTYTPVRFVSEELGADVEWIEAEQKVVITK